VRDEELGDDGRQRVKAAITAAWDRGAPVYDRIPRHGILHDDERRAWRRLVAAVLGDATHSEMPRRAVLDVGTGTGTLALLAAELGHDVVAIDLSEAMILAARRKSIESGIAVDWRIGDAEDPPVPEASFDAVVSRHLVWTLPDPLLAARAWHARLRPGGLVAVIDGTYPRQRLPLRVLAAAAIRLVGNEDDDEHEYPAEIDARLPLLEQRNPEAMMAVLRQAGFERVRARGLAEIDRVERAHIGLLQRTADGWRRYLVVGRRPRA
jgi:SAM-dependent methyltransferase